MAPFPPAPPTRMVKVSPGVTAFDDLRAWASTRAADAAIDYPPLVWVESPQVARAARMVGNLVSLASSGNRSGGNGDLIPTPDNREPGPGGWNRVFVVELEHRVEVGCRDAVATRQRGRLLDASGGERG